MFIGILRVEFTLHGNESLKDKRRVAASLKQKVRNKFNMAVAEAGAEDDMGRLVLALVSVSNDQRHLQGRMDKCLNMVEAACPEEMTYSDIEIMAAD